jgi:hypothetical protein
MAVTRRRTTNRRSIMKIISTALVSLGLLAGAIAPAGAVDDYPLTIKQLDKDQRGGHGAG